MDQATMTADTYFQKAIRHIDNQFGDGYAEKHSELIGAFMSTAASDFHTAIIAQHIAETIREASETINRGIYEGIKSLEH